jgi:hypothetical protein
VVTVQAQGFAPFSTGLFTVPSRDRFEVSPITLSIEEVTASVTVRPIEAIAEEQIKAQEQQRLFGFVPNFYVSYIPDAAPLASRQKLSLATRHTFDWTAFAGATVSAAIQQAVDAHPGYGSGASGYAKRWAAAFATERSNDLLSHYVFASLFHGAGNQVVVVDTVRGVHDRFRAAGGRPRHRDAPHHMARMLPYILTRARRLEADFAPFRTVDPLCAFSKGTGTWSDDEASPPTLPNKSSAFAAAAPLAVLSNTHQISSAKRSSRIDAASVARNSSEYRDQYFRGEP